MAEAERAGKLSGASAPEITKQAAKEIAAGQPGPTARRVLAITTVIVTILFAIDTVLVLNHALLAIDLGIAIFVQQFNWGPLALVMAVINGTAGYVQVAAGVVAIVALFVLERRAGWLMLIGSVSSGLDNVIKLVISRQRPPADLVHILNPVGGYSYPSGHAVFFTWLSFMVAFAVAPRIKPAWRPALWGGAMTVILLACLARVWAGAHWPSDVMGGVLLGIGWSSFVLWLPERWLPSPRWRWFRGRPRAT